LILNENPPGSHSDIHCSLNELKDQGVLKNFHIYPFLARLADGLNDREVTREIVNIAQEFQPVVVLWAHTGKLFVDGGDISKIRSLSSRPAMGYWDGDIYQRPQTPPKNALTLCKKCDVVFVQGDGDFSNLLKKKNYPDIRYVPAFTDSNRFCKLRAPDQEITYDVVMIGNNVSSKIPWRTAPGSRWRKELAEFFFKKLGNRFAVFGHGWKTGYGKGPLPFDEQVNAYHSSRMGLGVNNALGARYYFSNRLPIALSSGVPFIHNYEAGYEEIFKPIEDFCFFRTTSEAWNMTKQLLEKDQSELDKIGLKAYKFAVNRLTATDAIRYMISLLRNHRLSKEDGKEVEIRANPWINAPKL
jgi:hypothetical protein